MALADVYKALWSVGAEMTIANGFQFDWVASEDRIMRETPDQNPVYFISLMDEDDQENLDSIIGGGGAQNGEFFNSVPMYLYTQTPLYVPNSSEESTALYNYSIPKYSELVAYEGLDDAIRAFDLMGPLGSLMCQYIAEITYVTTEKVINENANQDNTIQCVSRFDVKYRYPRLR